MIEALGEELSYKNFEGIITDYENSAGLIPGMYRDPRGTLYHPHTGEVIALGTLAVEEYGRPDWTFNKVLYIEMEGPFEALKAARWPERHDCALLTSKGFTTRAVKDLLDLLAEDGEPVKVFCVHDADASGTMIYETLQEETRARGRRLVEIINLGLDPWEALDLGLQVEKIDKRSRVDAVARYVLSRADGGAWASWLSSQRVELNAMTTPDFIAWLDRKVTAHSDRKVIPPAPTVAEEMRRRLEAHKRRVITERILREAKLDDQVQRELAELDPPSGEDMIEDIAAWLGTNEAQLWREYVNITAQQLADQPK